MCFCLTDKKIQAVDRNGHYRDCTDSGALARLAMQNQEVRAEMCRSLQLRRLQKVQLQTSLRQLRQTSDDDKELVQSAVSCSDFKEEPSNIKHGV